MAIAAKSPIKTRKEYGKLAQARRALKAQAASETPQPVVDGPAMIFQAMEKIDGFTYPTMGPQLVLAGAKYSMSREVHAAGKQFVSKVRITLDKKGV